MNRVVELQRTELLEVGRFDHPPDDEHCDPGEEFCSDYCVSFVERGRFAMASGRRKHRLGAGCVILTRPGLSFRCTHYEACPDDVCLCVSFRDNTCAEEAMLGISRPVRPRLRDFVRLRNNRLAYLQLRLSRLLASASESLTAEVPAAVDGLALDTLGAELLGAAHAPADGFAARLYSEGQLSWYTDRIEAVREMLDRRFDQQHSLSSLASHVHMSPFHFARVFSAVLGMPPHRYLRELRLQRAAELLRSGCNVTEACFASGFNNLSHFSRSFRRRYNRLPSRFVH
jgi:AraC family transcriptional regulator